MDSDENLFSQFCTSGKNGYIFNILHGFAIEEENSHFCFPPVSL